MLNEWAQQLSTDEKKNLEAVLTELNQVANALYDDNDDKRDELCPKNETQRHFEVQIRELPRGLLNFKDQVRFLNMSSSELYDLPEWLGELNCLESLTIAGKEMGWSLLAKLPDSLGKLKALTTLVLEDCERLPQLPSSIADLSALRTLILKDCSQLTELPTLPVTLQFMRIQNCHKLHRLPDSIGNLHSLEWLMLKNLNIRELPASLCDLKALTTLEIILLRHLAKLPDNIGKLSSLKMLWLQRIPELRELPELPSSLVELQLHLPLMDLPPSFSNLISLKMLAILPCQYLAVEGKSKVYDTLCASMPSLLQLVYLVLGLNPPTYYPKMQQADFVQEPSPDELLRVLAGLKAWPREHSCEIVQRFQLVEDDKILRMRVFHQIHTNKSPYVRKGMRMCKIP